MSVKIEVRDSDLDHIGQIDDWQSLSVQRIWNDAGRWTIDLDADTWGAGVLDEDHGITIDYNGRHLVSGPVDQIKRSKKGDSNRVVFSGPDDNIWIKGRQAWPCAPSYGLLAPFPESAYDVRTGDVDSVVKGYVEANCLASGWDDSRQVDHLVVADRNGVGTAVTCQARFDMLDELINAAALAGGDIGWQVIEQDGALVFDTFEPIDVFSTVKFSVGLGNLAEYEYEIQRPSQNWVIVAGQGEGDARTFVILQDDASVEKWGRIEGPLVDRRDTNDIDQLMQSAVETLAKATGTLSIAATVNDTDGMVFWTHWGLGRRVCVVVDGVPYTEIIREVDVTWDNADTPVSIRPLIGSPQARRPEVPAIFANQRRTAQRISKLERL